MGNLGLPRPVSVTMEQGIDAVRIARTIIEGFVGDPSAPLVTAPTDPAFALLGGVFVTINEHPSLRLRGCIGYPLPRQTLAVGLAQAARSACRDPRFQPLRAEELEGIIVEVSFLTPPEPLVGPAQERPGAIIVGLHGLVISHGSRIGLLLPQVAVGQGWGAREFLGHACLKAGLPAPSWENPVTKVEIFQAHVWSEQTPQGVVSKVFP